MTGWLPGQCLDSEGNNQERGLTTLIGKTTTECLLACTSHEGATGCEFFQSGSTTKCSAHTRNVGAGSGDSDYTCILFKEPGLPLIIKHFQLSLIIMLLRISIQLHGFF